MPIVEAPTAIGLTSAGRKVAEVPVVPQRSEAMSSATTPAMLRFSTPRRYRWSEIGPSSRGDAERLLQ